MPRLTTLCISSRTIKYMVFKDTTATAWGTVSLNGIVKNGLIHDPLVTGRQLKSLFDSAKIPTEKVICTLNGLPFSYRFFTLPNIDAPSRKEAISRMAKQEMPLDTEEMILSWHDYPADREDERQFLVTGISRRPVEALIKTLSAAGIKPYRMCLPHTALASLNDAENAIVVDFEPDYANIILIVKGVPAGMHTVPLAGTDASQQETTDLLLRELSRMTDFYNDKHPNNLIPETIHILISGELANETEILNHIKEKSGNPLEITNRIPGNTPVIPGDAAIHDYAINIGCARREKLFSDFSTADQSLVHDINLTRIIAEASGIKKHKGQGKKWILSAVLAAGIITLTAGYMVNNQANAEISRLNTERQQAEEQLAETEASSKLAKATEDSIKTITTAAQQMENDNRIILDTQETVKEFDILIKSMPTRTIFNTIDVNDTQISITGITTAQERVVEYVRALEASKTFDAASIIWIDKSSNDDAVISFLIIITR